MTKPVFAAVGHPNKGKSSIVATLAQDDSVIIGNTPGTTARSRYFPMKVDGEVLYVLVDTPGFQRARRALEWMKQNETTADKHPAVVRKFLETHRDGDQFFDECQLLTPLMEESAGILYVVDGSVPYGPEYEAEMEILRWTGQPSMALINPVGNADHIESWRTALGQYFKLVRVFNAVKADFHKGIELLRAFGQLNDDWQSQLQQAVNVLIGNRQHRQYQSAQSISNTLVDMLVLKEEKSLSTTAIAEQEKAPLEKKYCQKILQIERRTRKSVEDIYAHKKLERIEDEKDIFEDVDLFSEESLRLFGLSRLQLTGLGIVSGAGTGGVIDLAVGGSSFLIGTLVGGCLGAAGAYFSASKLIEAKILKMPLGKKTLVVGPARNINFPHIIFNRARLHHFLISNRTHAEQGDFIVNESLNSALRSLTNKETKGLEKVFKGIRRNGSSAKQREELANVILDIFTEDGHEIIKET